MGFIDKIFGIIGASVLSQFPQLIQQYEFHLAGHVSELRIHVESMRRIASDSGKTLEKFVQKFIENSDADIARQGELMRGMVSRFLDLSDSYKSLHDASLFERPFLFIYHLKWEIFREALGSFQIGFSLSLESAVYAICGIVLGLLLARLSRSGLAAVYRICIPKRRASC